MKTPVNGQLLSRESSPFQDSGIVENLLEVWIFEWDELQQTITAQKVCNSLPALSSLEYCEPDSLQRPATGSIT